MKYETTTYLFVVDTDSYAGNFERELASYMTGVCGETHGQDEADEAMRELPKKQAEWIEENAIVYAEDHGEEVGHIFERPDFQSVSIKFNCKPPSNVIVALKERANKYASTPRKWGTKIKIKGFRLLKQTEATKLEEI